VLDADAVVHALYDMDAVRTALHLRWGDDVFDGDRVDRAAVARIVFKSPDQRAWLEGLLWPLTAQRSNAFRAELELIEPRPRAGVVEVPLLFEAEAAARFDATVAVVADDRLRRERLALRTQEELASREARQLDQHEKAARATFTIINEGTLAELEEKVAEILDTLAP
jgi:dephospho-CoA kinase